MQKLTLTFSRTNRYLEVLVKQDVISYNPINNLFNITEKGRKVLMLNQQLAAYISPVDTMIRKYSRYLKYPDDADETCYFAEEAHYPLQNSMSVGS